MYFTFLLMLMTGPFRIATKFGFRALGILNVVIYNPVLTNVSIPAWSQEDYRYYVLPTSIRITRPPNWHTHSHVNWDTTIQSVQETYLQCFDGLRYRKHVWAYTESQFNQNIIFGDVGIIFFIRILAIAIYSKRTINKFGAIFQKPFLRSSAATLLY